MKIAYLIAAHTDPIQLGRLIRALEIPECTHFFVHIDAKKDLEVFKKEIPSPCVTYCKSRFNVSWGGILSVNINKP